MAIATMSLRIGHLYPDELNIYGDRGNLVTLYRRCEWRGISVSVTPLPLNQSFAASDYDLLFMGGGQDSQQIQVCQDMQKVKKDSLLEAAQNKVVFLTICGGYQLMGHYYQPHQGDRLPGLSLIDAYTVAGHNRFIGNVCIVRPNGQTVVGFENHSGLTYLGEGVTPLGKVKTGHGNNGQSGFEGAVVGNLYGTYLHGSLLPKNPDLADELIVNALQNRYQEEEIQLAPLENQLELKAHQRASLLTA